MEKDFKSLTATEILARQWRTAMQWDNFYHTANTTLTKGVRNLIEMEEKSRLLNKLIEEILDANPHMTYKTVDLARIILTMYPKMDRLENMEIIIPFILSLSYGIQKLLDKRIPKEWK
jgi:hypothetical protein